MKTNGKERTINWVSSNTIITRATEDIRENQPIFFLDHPYCLLNHLIDWSLITLEFSHVLFQPNNIDNNCKQILSQASIQTFTSTDFSWPITQPRPNKKRIMKLYKFKALKNNPSSPSTLKEYMWVGLKLNPAEGTTLINLRAPNSKLYGHTTKKSKKI